MLTQVASDTVISNNKDLYKIYKEILKYKIIYIDTEFERSRTFYAILCLVQISVNNQIFLIDCLANNINLKIIRKILENKKIIKIFHSCLQDCYVFIDVFGKRVKFKNIHDTQLIANICGYKKDISYADLIYETMDISIEKESRRSNWLKRPLSQKQIDYAKNDVFYLSKSYKKLISNITSNNKLKQFKQEINKLNKKLNLLVKNYNPYKKFSLKNKSYFYTKKLKKIVDFRNIIAQKINKPRSFIINDKLINYFLKHPPKSISEINKNYEGRRIHYNIKYKIIKICNKKENLLDKIKRFLII